MEGWLTKLSCCNRSHTWQQFWLSNGQTGEHLAHKPFVLKPHSSRTACNPFGSPDDVVIFCGFPQKQASGFVSGIMVSFCFLCFPPSDLFMLNAWSASGGRDAYAEDWLKINRAWHPGCAASKIWIASLIWVINCLLSHHGSPFELGKIILWASQTISPLPEWRTSHPVSLQMKSDTWISQPYPFFWSGCSSCLSLSERLD